MYFAGFLTILLELFVYRNTDKYSTIHPVVIGLVWHPGLIGPSIPLVISNVLIHVERNILHP